MEVSGGFAVAVTDPSGAGEARRRVQRLAEALGFGETEAGRAALAATEAATNLAKHARDGVILVHPCRRGDVVGVQMLALDRGPGMRNPAECLRDGYSTAGSPGTGLGALSRTSDDFELFSTPGVGTVLLARVWSADPGHSPADLSVGAVAVAKPGQEVCGDSWGAVQEGERTLLVVADGLGHGSEAAEASGLAVEVFRKTAGSGPVAAIHAMHAAMRHTRGAAVAVAEVDAAAGRVCYAGVGNIAGTIVSPGGTQSMVSHNGTVGHEARKVHAFEYAFPKDAMLVLASDGIGTRWTLDRYPGLLLRDPAVLAAVLYRDFARGNDDATVLAARRMLAE